MGKFVNIWIAIPDSSISDEQTKRDKSIKISRFARACSIFRVSRIYIYHDKTSRIDKEDTNILKILLSYLDTPQYLRKILYPRMPQLEYAGILHPIKAPHHKKFEDIKDCYWGYEVRGVSNLHELLQETERTKIIITSKKGAYFHNKEGRIVTCLNSIHNLLVVFGAPKKGVDEILASEGQSMKSFEFVVNMFPYQATETVRLEEAVLGTLAILNYTLFK